MVFFALTRPGLDELAEHFGRLPSPLWLNQGLLSEEELADLRAKGADITTFSQRIAPGDAAGIEHALAVIAEHHVGQRIWVERSADV